MSILKIVAAVLAGVVLGLLVTIYALDPESRAVKTGPWRSAPRSDGAAGIDPYGLAIVERTGLLPPGAAEGAVFIASTDDTGAAFSAQCDYTVVGPMPPVRFWTLSVLGPSGVPLANPAERYGFTSAEILREADQPVSLIVSNQARPGNWLPVPVDAPHVLMLALYDPGLGASATGFDKASMPSIRKEGCR